MNNNKKATKRALLTSVMALVMCVVMLVGTTFAWFTDTASTAVNKIQAGNLDVELLMHNGEKYVNISKEKEPIFGSDTSTVAQNNNLNTLWEPGKTQVAYLAIKNEGNLALKYKVALNVTNPADGKDLYKVMQYAIVPDAQPSSAPTAWTTGKPVDVGQQPVSGEVSLAVGATHYFALLVHMDELAGNNYQNGKVEFDLTVYATQDTVEYDSFGKDYDKNATYPVVVSRNGLNTSLTLDALKDANGKVSPVEVTLGNTAAEDINYSQNNSGYTGKGVMLGSTKLNSYAAAPAEIGEYKFTFKNGIITSEATGYQEPDGGNGPKNSSVYMMVPGNSDVVFENMTFNGVVSFDIQKYTSPWSNLNSITFKNCVFNGIIVGTCPADNVTFDGCVFNNYTNSPYANNSNPIWWRSDTEGTGANANPIKTFTFVNNKVTSTRPVKIERIDGATLTFKNNYFDISKQNGDTVTKNMAINIGQRTNTSAFTLIDEGNTISKNTASLYTAALGNGSNQYVAVSGNKVLDGSGNAKVITAMVWKTTTGETFEMKSVK